MSRTHGRSIVPVNVQDTQRLSSFQLQMVCVYHIQRKKCIFKVTGHYIPCLLTFVVKFAIGQGNVVRTQEILSIKPWSNQKFHGLFSSCPKGHSDSLKIMRNLTHSAPKLTATMGWFGMSTEATRELESTSYTKTASSPITRVIFSPKIK